MTPDIERLRAAFEYLPETGELIRRRTFKRWIAGTPTGSKQPSGYVLVHFEGNRYRAHRVAWAIQTGSWPVDEIDHRNGHRDDNQWTNLREASHSINMQNVRTARCTSASGFLGVSFRLGNRTRPWRASIRLPGGVRLYLGGFTSAEDAAAAYLAAKRQHHEGCTL